MRVFVSVMVDQSTVDDDDDDDGDDWNTRKKKRIIYSGIRLTRMKRWPKEN